MKTAKLAAIYVTALILLGNTLAPAEDQHPLDASRVQKRLEHSGQRDRSLLLLNRRRGRIEKVGNLRRLLPCR